MSANTARIELLSDEEGEGVQQVPAAAGQRTKAHRTIWAAACAAGFDILQPARDGDERWWATCSLPSDASLPLGARSNGGSELIML